MIEVYVEHIDGQRQSDTAFLDHIEALLPGAWEEERPFLSSIDPYGDTLFNSVQMRQFLREWASIEARVVTEPQRQTAAAVARMARQCANGLDLFLRFVGD